jgi:hypothetical protein
MYVLPVTGLHALTFALVRLAAMLPDPSDPV